jgi:hypothetical protein
MKKLPRRSRRPRRVKRKARTVRVQSPTPAAAETEVVDRDRLPPFRRLRAYALDPGAATELDTVLINEVVLRVMWEEQLAPGPVGEYLEVIDHDPSSECFYPPVDLNDPLLLAQDGLRPSEGNPQFHQQMVYGVAMTTIANFQRALGRRVFWSDRARSESGPGHEFMERLRIYPHALRQANAFYSPDKKALLFGYFPADPMDAGAMFPGGTVFTCLSHDIVAHETTHALLDGLHRRLIEPTHPDVLAFHEAFADIVALFQHFSFPEVVKHQIARKRGDLASQSLLGELAQQFGRATGRRGALREALGGYDKNGEWRPKVANPEDYENVFEPHDRGAILVGAVFDAFLSIYRARVADLFRLATGGTGVLPAGAIHPDLVARLSDESSKSAQHVLNMCVRALDYCPPVDLTFGEYLRAIVTADLDLVPDDDRNYRIAFIDAFKRRGIYPRDVRSLSVDSLRWQQVTDKNASRDHFERIGRHLKAYVQETFGVRRNRREVYDRERAIRAKLHDVIQDQDVRLMDQFEETTGLVLQPERMPEGLKTGESGIPKFEVHSARPARRAGPDGDTVQQIVLSVTQRRRVPIDPAHPLSEDNGFWFRGGCTMILDLDSLELQYAIRKRITSENRLRRQREFMQGNAGSSLRATYFQDPVRDNREPFAFLHRPV